MLTIYTYHGEIRAIVHPEPANGQVKELMSVDVFNLSFSTPVPINLMYGDYLWFDGRKFCLNTSGRMTKSSKRNYEYEFVFDSDTQNLGKCLYLFLDQNNQFTEPIFSMTGNAYDFVFLLIKNLERLYAGYGWEIGSVVDHEAVTIDFTEEKGTNCLEVLGILADRFATEWFIEGKKINLYRKQANSGIVLRQGKGGGLYELTISPQNNANPITRVYGYGSDRNIGSNYRGGARRLRMGAIDFIEKNTGLSSASGPFDVIEVVKVFPEIYPRRKGEISSITSPTIFTDDSMDFDINAYLMPATDARIEFTSGLLAGNSFKIESYDEETKTFEILADTNDPTLEIPSVLLTPEVGDKYVLLDILMPDIYILNAERELKQAVSDWLDQKAGEVPTQIDVTCDPLKFKETGEVFTIGQVVTVQDELLGLDRQIRVIGFSRNYSHPYMYTLKLADTVKENLLVKLIKP